MFLAVYLVTESTHDDHSQCVSSDVLSTNTCCRLFWLCEECDPDLEQQAVVVLVVAV